MSPLHSPITDPSRAHAIGREAAALFDLTAEGALRASGKDAKRYLHRMTSNDIEGLKDGEGCHALYLTNKGRVISELWIYQLDGETFDIQVPAPAFAQVLQRFTMFVINDDVSLEDRGSGRMLWSLQGPKAEATLASLGAPIPQGAFGHGAWSFEGVSCRLLRRARIGGEGFDLVAPKEGAEALAETLRKAVEEHGGAVIDGGALEALRIEAGVADFARDTRDVLPQEAFLERTAVSFEKGCYPGQETVAKIKYRGHVNRHLVRFEIEGEAPEVPCEVWMGDQKLGLLTSAARIPSDGKVRGLGYLKREHAAGECAVEIAIGDERRAARALPA